MNKIQFSPLFVNFCSKNNLDINMVYLCQCALMAENPQECLSVLLESLRSDDFDQLLRLVLCNWEDEFIIRSEVPLFFMIPTKGAIKESFVFVRVSTALAIISIFVDSTPISSLPNTPT